MDLKKFIGRQQLSAMLQACDGEDGSFFRDMMSDLEKKIAAMPKTNEADGTPGKDFATLHYFMGGSDWWIVERDMENEQRQAFGFACLNGDAQNAEMGYISIKELIENGVELDLYYKQERIEDIRTRLGQ